MKFRQRELAYAMIAWLGMGGVAAAANGTCGLTGKWHYNAIVVFGSSQSVVDCTISIRLDGTYSGSSCKSWTLGQASQVGPGTGAFVANSACDLSGYIKVPNFPTTVITGGHVKGSMATAVGVRGALNKPTQVRLITLIRQ